MTSSPDPVVAAGRIGGGAAGRGGGPAAGAAPPPAGTRPGPAAPLESSIPSPRVEPVVFNPFEEGQCGSQCFGTVLNGRSTWWIGVRN